MHLPARLCEHLCLVLQIQKCLLVMTWNDLSFRCALELLQALRTSEPGRMVTG